MSDQQHTTDGVPTPELDRMLEVMPQAQIIQGFYDWLIENQGIELWVRPTEIQRDIGDLDGDPAGLAPDYRSPEQLFADYFGLDLQKIEQERRAILDVLREI